jgi:CPA1 family monovalent cation:H+ antiporter
MKVMLGFLLFAGAIHIHAASLKKESLPILTLATLGTLLSTFIVGYLFYFTLQILHIQMDLIYCLLFGSLISPTDPVAVLGILKKAGVPHSLELKIAGESLLPLLFLSASWKLHLPAMDNLPSEIFLSCF